VALSFLPPEVRGGIRSAIVPQGVGTSTFAPSIASESETGSVISSVSPERRKIGWG
jgi:hypothetical protein